MAHPHMIERRTVREIDDRLLGKFKIPGMPLRFSKYEVDENIQAPLLGEHNAEILQRFLKYPPAQVRDLESRKVLFSKPV
jgi:CoA:oxalate CoA-transferase